MNPILMVICMCGLSIVVAILGIVCGYHMGHKDAYMEWLEKEEYYDWLIEMKKKEDGE